MGIVINQSIKNTVATYVGFGIGAVNTLFLYTNFMSDEYYGLVTFILSTANVLMPLMAFGAHNSIIKFYSSYKTRQQQSSFLMLMVVLPLAIILPLGAVGYFTFDAIAGWLSKENNLVKDYVWLIYVSAFAFAYFEVFYAWSKVQLKSVFGNFMKEIFHRACITVLLFCLHFKWISIQEFIYAVVGVYLLRTILMKLYAFSLRKPVLRLLKINNLSAVLKYTSLIVIAGSVAMVVLEIDKFMIGKYIPIENVAYYAVAIYIASVIQVPYRSLKQIANPITAQLLNDKNWAGLKDFYKKSSINLFIISGFIFLCIVLNIKQMYHIIPEAYSSGLLVVVLISLAKLMDNVMGNNHAILFNSDYYRMVLLFGILLTVLTVVLNMLLIPRYGIDGAALATFISMVGYNAVKLLFVNMKLKMQPFTIITLKVFVLILVCTALFYFWDFPFHPVLNIALKTALVALIYGVVVYRLNFSEDVSRIIRQVLRLN